MLDLDEIKKALQAAKLPPDVPAFPKAVETEETRAWSRFLADPRSGPWMQAHGHLMDRAPEWIALLVEEVERLRAERKEP